MGAAELEEALRRQGAESALSIVEEARREVEEQRAAFDASWDERRHSALADAEAEVKESTGARLIAARRAAKRRVLQARHGAIERVIDAVRARLLSGIEREPQLDELLAYLPSGEVQIQQKPDGCIITSQDGSVTVDDTLTRRLEQMRP